MKNANHRNQKKTRWGIIRPSFISANKSLFFFPFYAIKAFWLSTVAISPSRSL